MTEQTLVEETEEAPEETETSLPEGPDAPSEEAPYGWMIDPVTKEKRPRKRAGRRSRAAAVPSGRTPPIEELQGLGSVSEGSEDVAPGTPPKRKGRRRAAMKAQAPLPPFRAGLIAKGVNKQYRRAGRIIRMWNYQIGSAVIAAATVRPKDDDDQDEDDLTVGEAWENLAKTNPRVRRWLLRLVSGGIMGDLFQAHLPILLAVLMAEGVQRRLPLAQLLAAFVDDGQDQEHDGGQDVMGGMGAMMGGLGPDDMAQMMQMVQQTMNGVAMNLGRDQGVPRVPVGLEHPADQG